MKVDWSFSRFDIVPLLTGVAIAVLPVPSAMALDFGLPDIFSGKPQSDPCELQYNKVQLHEERMVPLVDPNTFTMALDCMFKSGSSKSECLKNLGQGAVKGAQQNYLAKKRQQARNRAQLLAAVDQDAGNQVRYLRGLNADIVKLRQCRQSMHRSIQSRQRAKRLSAADSKRELGDLEKLIARDQKLITGITGQTAVNTNVLVDSSTELGVYQSNRGSSRGSKCVSGRANVRGGPSTSKAPIGKLQAGECVAILGSVSGGRWYEVDFDGRSGYMHRSVFGGSSTSGGNSNVAKAEQSQKQLEEEQQSFSALMKEIEDSREYLESDV